MSRIGSSLSAAIMAGTLLVVGGCADVPSVPSFAADLHLEKIAAPAAPLRSIDGASSAVIGPRGGELVSPAGHRIVFPAGALPQPTLISMADDAEFVGVHLEPHGIRFPAGRSPVLTLDLNGAPVGGYEGVHIVYVGTGGDILEVLPTSLANGSAEARLRHFSGYIASGGRSAQH